MTIFDEKLRETIRTAKEERKSEDQKRIDFTSRWEARKLEILRLLERAAKIITSEFGESTAAKNGAVILWLTGYKLEFNPNENNLEIICRSSVVEDSGEGYSLENLTNAVVEHKVREFVRTVIKKVKPESSAIFYELTW